MRDYYPAAVCRDPDTDTGVSFPDFPGCVTTGAAIAAALRNAERLLRQIDAAAEAKGMTRSRWLAVTAGNRLADADA
jgi:predicted RNase H-like HicB family nuclease